MVSELIRLGADVEASDNVGLTPLAHACVKGLVHVMHVLITKVASDYIKS